MNENKVKPFSYCSKNLKTEQIPECLLYYHYCDAVAFESIVRHKCIYLSRADFMNDGLEYILLQKTLKEIIDPIVDKLDCPEREKHLNALRRVLAMNSSYPYLASFSRVQDRLSQWTRYANDGSGFSLAFNSEEFECNQSGHKWEEHRLCGFEFSRVLYRSIQDLKEQLTGKIEDYLEEPTIYKIYNLVRLAIGIKHETFSEEEELRITFYPRYDPNGRVINPNTDFDFLSGIDFRVSRKGGLIPYFKMQCPLPRIVMIGPKNPMTVDQVEFYLHQKGHSDLIVKKSSSPYR